ncbi:MAG: hypothetical protein ABIU63_15680 [Chitinophagaceae bacterium]
MPLYIKSIVICFVASLIGAIFFKENRKIPLVLFPVFLIISFIGEYYGFQSSAKNQNNTLFYNLFSLFDFVFYLFFFFLIAKNRKIRNTIASVTVVYTAISLVNIFFYQGRDGFHSYTYVLGCILVVVNAILYFYFLFRMPETINLLRNPFFWIAAGLMFYYACTFSLFGLTNFIIQNGYYNNILTTISDFLNILLYSLYIIAFLCRTNLRNSLQ